MGLCRLLPRRYGLPLDSEANSYVLKVKAMSSIDFFRTRLIEVERQLNNLHGKMSPQLAAALEWHRSQLLQLILEKQLATFDRN